MLTGDNVKDAAECRRLAEHEHGVAEAAELLARQAYAARVRFLSMAARFEASARAEASK
jgi:hypothetical protein